MKSLFSKIGFLIKMAYLCYVLSLVSAIKSIIKFKTFSVSNTVKLWNKAICQYLGVKFIQIKSQHKLREQKTIFLVNHRTLADLFLHTIITQSKSNFLSRRQVALLLGFASFMIRKRIWFFNRSAVIQIEKFNQWLDYKFSQSPLQSLIVYPQGHRMYEAQKVDKTRLKRGMIKYAYSRKIPIQILMSFGNQQVLNQKKFSTSYGKQVKYKIGKVIYPEDFENANDFVQQSLQEFGKFFDQTINNIENNQQQTDTTRQLYDSLFCNFQ